MPRSSGKSPDISAILPEEYTFISSTQIATLWGGYGHIHRIQASLKNDGKKSLILKTIAPPPTRQGTADEGHLRKLLSYKVERWFYYHLSTKLLRGLNSPKVAVAYSPRTSIGPEIESLLLEDLIAAGFPRSASYGLEMEKVKAVLRWLARFHAAFWGHSGGEDGTRLVPPPLDADPQATNGSIWMNGGYWYLATRSAENEDMISNDEYPWLKQKWVVDVANKLAARGEGVVGQTVLHGDCKGANILFSSAPGRGGGSQAEEGVEAALYDFQYVGLGFGVVDLAYFLGTSVPGQFLENGGDEVLLAYYYEQLMLARGVTGGTGDPYSKDVFAIQMDWALVDWFRFMAGWGTWGGGHRWVEKQAKRAVSRWEKAGQVENI
ncbi:kinase-like domain-containing protein [Peziza echinospora]|nr:kinase-like domain-containing protein [Peziza echinospora]